SRSWCWAWVPWLKFRRKTSAPASNRARMLARSELAGPSVATILAWRRRRMVSQPARTRREEAAIDRHGDSRHVSRVVRYQVDHGGGDFAARAVSVHRNGLRVLGAKLGGV